MSHALFIINFTAGQVKKTNVIMKIECVLNFTMKFSIFVLLFINSNIVTGQVLNFNAPSTAKLNDKFEISFNLPSYSNVYNTDTISCYAEFWDSNNNYFKVFGFYYKGYNSINDIIVNNELYPREILAHNSVENWRIRFSPNAVGFWFYKITVIDSDTTYSYPNGNALDTLYVTQSNNNSLISISTNNTSLVRNGKTFFPVGINIAIPEHPVGLWYGSQTFGTFYYRSMFDKLKANKSNFIRLWLDIYRGFSLIGYDYQDHHNYKFNDYNQKDAWQVDTIIEYARANNINIMLTLFDSHTWSNTPDTDNSWDNFNPYNFIHGGMLSSPYYFPSNQDAIKQQKQYINYVIARWGYANNIMAWELWNEVGQVKTSLTQSRNIQDSINYFTHLPIWHDTIASFIRKIGNNRHIITTSYSKNCVNYNGIFNSMDLVQGHFYQLVDISRHPTTNYITTYLSHIDSYSISGKPFFAGEIGYWDTTNYNMNTVDPNGVQMHNILSASIMSKDCGIPPFWHWEDYINKQNLIHRLKGVGAIKDKIDLNGSIIYNKSVSNGYRVYYIKNNSNNSIYGYIQDTNFTFKNLTSDSNSMDYILTFDSLSKPFVDTLNNSFTIPAALGSSNSYKIEWYNTNTGKLEKSVINNLQVGASTFQSNIPSKLQTDTFADAFFVVKGNFMNQTTLFFEGETQVLTDIVIDSGQTLTIMQNSIVDMCNSSITVKKGGKLIIDGGKITSKCGMWDGIVVEGDASLPQFPMANQGWLYMRNGATIENAEVGIHILSEPQSLTTPYDPYGGGVIRISDSKFINNAYSIMMEKYKDTISSGFIKANLCSIINTQFETNAKLIDSINYPNPIAFIQLNGVHKLRIKDCKFKNTYSNNMSNQNHGIGIDAFNSNFFISGDSTKFNNLEFGIKANATQSNIPLSIIGAEFENNANSIYINAVSNAKVTLCNFDEENKIGYGLYLDNCTDYTIEQNTYTSPSNSTTATAGMVINNSGSDANEVYNNYFYNFPAAMLAQHDNWGQNEFYGLTIKCNDFNNCMQDIAITESLNYTGLTGISAKQGSKVSNSSLAGNTFSHKGQSIYFGNNPYSDYNNERGVVISKYYHHDGTVSDAWVPKYYTYGDPTTGNPLSQTQIVPENVSGEPYVKAQSCPDRQISNGGSSVVVLYDSLNSLQTQLNSANLILSIYQDGGNTDLNEEVALAYPWETYQYYNELMLASPYLSDETMIEAINNTSLLPTNLLKLILLANPQCSRSDEVMDVLYSRIPAMPQADINQILQKQGDSSPIDELKANISYFTHERMRYAAQIKNNYLTDTVNAYAMDSLMLFLRREDYVNAKYQLAFLYLQNNNFEQMNETLNNISNNFELSERETLENTEFVTYFGIAQDMAENNLTYEELTPEQQQDLHTLADGIYLPSAYARSLLLKYDETFTYTEPVIFPVITSSRLSKPKENNSSKESFIKIYPNPAYDYISVDYKLVSGNGRIEIIDNIGRTLISKTISNLNGTAVIGLDKLSPGMYKLVFYEEGKLIETKQFSKIK